MENIKGMGTMTDQVVATDFLLAAKDGIRNYALALTETITPDVRMIFRNHLNDAIETHEKIINYMMDKGYYNAYDIKQQLRIDNQSIEAALALPTHNTSVF